MEPAHSELEIAELNPQRASSSSDFLCRIWYLCWNLTHNDSPLQCYPQPIVITDALSGETTFSPSSPKAVSPFFFS